MPSAFSPVANIHGGMTQLQQVICSGSQSVITFQNIPSNYSDLVIKFSGRATGATTFTQVYIKLNSDATAGNYLASRNVVGTTSNTTSSSANASTTSGGFVFGIDGTGDGATHPSTIANVEISAYASTVLNKPYLVIHQDVYSTGDAAEIIVRGGQWNSTAAINRIDLTIASGSFLDGTTCTLYGLGTGPGNSRGYDQYTGANPTTNLVDGRIIDRTEIGLIRYNAALGKWLTVQEYPLAQTQEGPVPLTASVTIGRVPLRSDYSYYYTRIAFETFLNGGTSNSTNKFSIVIQESNVSGSVISTLATIDTGATPDTASTWTAHDVAINTAASATAKQVTYSATKTGAPGNMYYAATLFARLIIT